jgi:Family of unknown function (DUF6027)
VLGRRLCRQSAERGSCSLNERHGLIRSHGASRLSELHLNGGEHLPLLARVIAGSRRSFCRLPFVVPWGMTESFKSIELVAWSGPWSDTDPDANFKADVALYAHLDPMRTIENLATAMGMPEGAIVRYVLAKWATAGSAGLLELGPSMIHRLWEPVEEAETADTDAARLAAYEQLRQMLSWLRLPVVDPDAAGY